MADDVQRTELFIGLVGAVGIRLETVVEQLESILKYTPYSTTFPCHNCARHIIAAGIRRVVYVAPYAKSQAFTLHQDAIDIARGLRPRKRFTSSPSSA